MYMYVCTICNIWHNSIYTFLQMYLSTAFSIPLAVPLLAVTEAVGIFCQRVMVAWMYGEMELHHMLIKCRIYIRWFSFRLRQKNHFQDQYLEIHYHHLNSVLAHQTIILVYWGTSHNTVNICSIQCSLLCSQYIFFHLCQTFIIL